MLNDIKHDANAKSSLGENYISSTESEWNIYGLSLLVHLLKLSFASYMNNLLSIYPVAN